jgi:hypothetical protein
MNLPDGTGSVSPLVQFIVNNPGLADALLAEHALWEFNAATTDTRATSAVPLSEHARSSATDRRDDLAQQCLASPCSNSSASRE